MYLAFTKDNPHADGKNGPRSAMIHGSVSDCITGDNTPTGRRRICLTKAGPIPGLEAEVAQLMSLGHLELDTDDALAANAEDCAAKLGWSLEVLY